ncbi:MAG: molybdopterin-guanine dinucleotide biosynthesis protein B [Candidatus Bathyarchaeota archaeon]
MPIIAVVGSRKSGKTTTIEALVNGLTKKGYKVATVKHIPEPDFSIDTEGKDTWRHTKAGALITLGVAPNELALVKKADTTKYGLDDIVKYCEDEVDIIVLEGFRNLVSQNPLIPKVVTVKTTEEVKESTSYFKPIIAFAGAISSKPKDLRIPYIDALQKPEELAEIVENKIKPMIKKEKQLEAAIKIKIDGNPLPLNLFVQKIMRTVVLSMVSTLKDVSIEGDENVFITIANPSK